MRALRGVLEQRAQLPLGATPGVILQRVPARKHQPDDRAGQVLAHRQCGSHRQQGDRVDSRIAAYEAAPNVDCQRHQDHGGQRRPDRIRRLRVVGERE